MRIILIILLVVILICFVIGIIVVYNLLMNDIKHLRYLNEAIKKAEKEKDEN